MSSFVQEFKKYQKQERLLTAVMVLISVLAPLVFTLMLNQKVHWVASAAVLAGILMMAFWIHILRDRISVKLLKKYEVLGIGFILSKKLSNKSAARFVITNTGFNHYYLKCLNTGEQVLVSKHRVREDFDIAN